MKTGRGTHARTNRFLLNAGAGSGTPASLHDALSFNDFIVGLLSVAMFVRSRSALPGFRVDLGGAGLFRGVAALAAASAASKPLFCAIFFLNSAGLTCSPFTLNVMTSSSIAVFLNSAPNSQK